MAKIYETKEDFERDKLKEQAQELRHDRTVNLYSGAISFIAAVFNYTTNLEKRSGWTTLISTLFGASSAFSWTLAWQNHSKARKLDQEREKLGPETVILPPGVGDDSVDKSCGCPLKPYSAVVGAKTLMEQAAKPEGDALGKG